MTLLMREQEIARDNFEKGKLEGMAEGVVKGREEGIAEGVVRGIKNLIDSFKELGIDEKIILQKLTEKYNLTKEEAEKYLK